MEFHRSWMHNPCSCSFTVQAPDMLCCHTKMIRNMNDKKNMVSITAIQLKFVVTVTYNERY
jgi:hypothetical protein